MNFKKMLAFVVVVCMAFSMAIPTLAVNDDSMLTSAAPDTDEVTRIIVKNDEKTNFFGTLKMSEDYFISLFMNSDDAIAAGILSNCSEVTSEVNILEMDVPYVIYSEGEEIYFWDIVSEQDSWRKVPIILDGDRWSSTGMVDENGNIFIKMSTALNFFAMLMPITFDGLLQDGFMPIDEVLAVVFNKPVDYAVWNEALHINTETSSYRMSLNGEEVFLNKNPNHQNDGSMGYSLKEVCELCNYRVANVQNALLKSIPYEGRVSGWMVIVDGKEYLFKANSNDILSEDGAVIHDNVNHGAFSPYAYPMTGLMGMCMILNVWPVSIIDMNQFITEDQYGHTVFNFASHFPVAEG